MRFSFQKFKFTQIYKGIKTHIKSSTRQPGQYFQSLLFKEGGSKSPT